MSRKLQSVLGIAGVALVAVYSWIMMTTEGAAAYAWMILVGAIALVAGAGRAAIVDREAGSRGPKS